MWRFFTSSKACVQSDDTRFCLDLILGELTVYCTYVVFFLYDVRAISTHITT